MSKKNKAETARDVGLDRLREIVKILEQSSLSALHFEDKDIQVRLTRGALPPKLQDSQGLEPADSSDD